jgi:hypothetical protein
VTAACVRAGVACCALALLAGCALGGEVGREASLEAEIALIDGQLRRVAEAAFGPYTVIGTRIGIATCDPDNRYRASVTVRLHPDTLPMEEARQAALDWVARSGSILTGDASDLWNQGLAFDELPYLVGAGFAFSLGRIGGVEMYAATRCYEPGRIQAADPYDLAVETGIRLDYRP